MPERTDLTAHGEVTYATVECTSCGNEVLDTEAKHVFVGDYGGEITRSYRDYDRVKLKDYSHGRLCPHCVDEGPARLPPLPNAVESWWSGLSNDEKVFGFLLGMFTLGMGVVFGGALV
ncbi:hypothetical protein NDI56_03815 [Haloarcula sp. S1CR25-12]|uniref:Uncharacterized protein n=1 Tax=Haloarcula saliterrae TaxID=2950534 RepID=A0ABU2F8F0_9EURY|nr:hypothetical protein [Haloarcula sp. S1CR25-12]MDS0258537.1 hypothetical protein [Haloarcula sp. S1CR25-12]